MQTNVTIANVFAALGDSTRLKLIAVLCVGGALSISQLTANTDISRQVVTKHLQVLAEAGVVRDIKMGRERLWQLEPAQIEEAKRTLEIIVESGKWRWKTQNLCRDILNKKRSTANSQSLDIIKMPNKHVMSVLLLYLHRQLLRLASPNHF